MKNNTGEQSAQGKPPGKKEEDKRKKKKNMWPLTALVITLIVSFTFSLISELIIGNTGLVIAYFLVFVIILINIVTDMIGTAVAACDIEPFLSMSARKVKGGKMAVRFVKNAEKVSNICCDVIGDICGIISGAASAAILAKQFVDGTSIFISVLFSAIIAALTVSGKALGKSYAMNNSNKIIFMVAKTLSIFKKN